MKRTTLATLLIMAVALSLPGCSDSPTNTTEVDSINLVDEFGGYQATPEQPAFGDNELLADDELEVEFDDPLLGSAEVTSLTADPESGLFHFRALWGQIPGDTTATDPIDFSGSLTITRGAEIVRRLVRFEPRQDYLIERTDRRLIEWVSQTTIHNDGIVVDLFIPPARPILDSTEVIDTDTLGNTTITYVVDTLDPEPVMVTFETGPYSRTFSLPELAALDTIVELDNGASVAFHAIQVRRIPCPGGFVIGGWGYDDQGQGRFRGRWMSYESEITGWLNGHFGQTEEGRPVLFGKWINRNGDCEGFMRGTYQRTRHRDNNSHGSDMHSGGKFQMRLFDSERNPIGVMHGQYQSAPERRGGFFQGRWRLDCARDVDPNQDQLRLYDDGLEPVI